MFGMAELQQQIGGYPVAENKMGTLAKHCPLKNSTMYMCQMGPAFQEPIDDDDDTADEEDDSKENESDDVGPGEDDTNAAMEMEMQPQWLWIFPRMWQPAELKHVA
uniref:Uncharacterized protein n=1 Tax=Solanum tuberosum TaxID=4113 RepID=M1DNN6_SOLTU